LIRLLFSILAIATFPVAAWASPNAEAAKRCLRAAYMLYPYKRPGAGPMTGGRLFYFKECMAKQQDGVTTEPAKQ
jgi:hypothetical protein